MQVYSWNYFIFRVITVTQQQMQSHRRLAIEHLGRPLTFHFVIYQSELKL